jgi:nucleoid-associated protein YgaU
MADINVKSRVIAKIGGKSYDLRPSGNPHAKLPKDVVKFLEDGDHLADVVTAPAAAGSSELARMQAEIDRLTTALATAEGERDTAKADQQRAEESLSAALVEIQKLQEAAKK